jgi:hypothetical protein
VIFPSGQRVVLARTPLSDVDAHIAEHSPTEVKVRFTAGALGYRVKPVDNDESIEQVSRIISAKRTRDDS